MSGLEAGSWDRRASIRFVSQLPVVLVAVFFVGACAGSGSGSGSPPVPGSFTVDSPTNGSVITASPVTIRGHAPAGARVVRDISLSPDQDVIAGTAGTWDMLVELEEGANELVFRLGDDTTTEVRIGLTYVPSPAASTPAPTTAPTAKPTTSYKNFGDGTLEIGVDISAGTYRLREPAGYCYWARLKGFDGTLSEIIANDNVINAYSVVTISKTDVGFESNDCGEWTSDLSQVTTSKSKLTVDGKYIVGTDLSAGKWRSSGGDYCYWARLSGFGGTLSNIIANDNVLGGSTIITIRSTDKGFETKGCGTWTRQ
jgi:hypothetical protein